ncbi:MAG: ribosome biogenesis GTPase Der [Endomicrobiales bacterium]
MHDTIVLIGRTNVGKSTLFNRIYGRRRALVHNIPGTTRDRNEVPITWEGRDFILIDTGGWAHDNAVFSAAVRTQLEAALSKAKLAVLVVDARHGFHPLDAELSTFLRKQGKPVLLAVNKVDSVKDDVRVADFYQLGIDEMIPVSAEQGRNVNELLDRLVQLLGPAEPVKIERTPIRVILVGKPNVGKSSLVNVLLKEERSIVHDVPGTTREALDVPLERDGRAFILIDTPGLHRKKKFSNDMQYLSALSTQHAVERADVAVLVMDVDQGIGETEAKVAELILENHKACLLALNKWDLVENKEQAAKTVERMILKKLSFLSWSKLLLISAKTGQRTDRLLDEVEEIYKEYSKRVPERELKEAIRDAETHKPLSRRGHVLRIQKVEQSGIHPPSFSFLVNDPLLVHFSYRRYLENALRARFGFTGTPIILRFHRADKKDIR